MPMVDLLWVSGEVLWTIRRCSHGVTSLPNDSQHQHLKETALQTAPLQPTLHPLICRLHICCLAAWTGRTAAFPWPHQSAISQYTIHYIEDKKDGRLAFLDVQVTRSPERLSTSVYRKPTHTDRYIPFHSHHHHAKDNHWGTHVHAWKSPPDLQQNNQGIWDEMPVKEVFLDNSFQEDLVRKTLTRHPTAAPPSARIIKEPLHLVHPWPEWEAWEGPQCTCH